MIDEEFPIGSASYTHGDRGPKVVTADRDEFQAIKLERDLLREAARGLVEDSLVAAFLETDQARAEGLVAKLQALKRAIEWNGP